MSKLTHEAVAFEHPAQGMSHCRECAHYVDGYPPGIDTHCRIVVDPIEPDDWCKRFEKR